MRGAPQQRSPFSFCDRKRHLFHEVRYAFCRYSGWPMTPRTEHLACSGLVVPVLTVLDEKGALIESDQRALVRYVVQGGDGADVVYAASAMGERDRLGADVWRSLEQQGVANPRELARAFCARLPVCLHWLWPLH